MDFGSMLGPSGSPFWDLQAFWGVMFVLLVCCRKVVDF